MPSFRDITEFFISVWRDSTPAARVGLVALIVLCATMLTYVGVWSSQPSYVNLVADGDTERIARIVDELDKKGIKYELGGAGGVLRVDQRQLPTARMVANKAGVNTTSPDQSGMTGIFEGKAERQARAIRAKAKMLETAIREYENIDDAKVFLNVPIRGPFERAVSKPSASVQLTLGWTRQLSEENVLAIASTVAAAVENLEPGAVKITDQKARLYPVPDMASGNFNTQQDFVNNEERDLVAKANSQLTSFFGEGNSSVQISLDYTFIHSETQSTDYDPDGKVAEKEELTTIKSNGVSSQPLGTAGVTPNLTAGRTGADSSDTEHTEETLDNSFLVPKTVESKINSTPDRNYMTVSVLVNDAAPGVRQDDGNLAVDIKQRVEQIVRNAVGFREDTDTITVDFATFPEPQVEEIAAPFDWLFIGDILRNVSLAVAALVVLFLGMMTLRHFKNIQLSKPIPVDSNQVTNLNQLNDLARTNPEIFSRILKSWAGDRQAQDVNQPPNKTAA